MSDGARESERGKRLPGRRRPAPAWLELLLIAASTGGPTALAGTLPSSSLGTQAKLLIVQHMAQGSKQEEHRD